MNPHPYLKKYLRLAPERKLVKLTKQNKDWVCKHYNLQVLDIIFHTQNVSKFKNGNRGIQKKQDRPLKSSKVNICDI